MKRLVILKLMLMLVPCLILTGCKAKVVRSFELNDGLAVAEASNGKWGYVTEPYAEGKIDWAIEPKFEYAGKFSYGVAWVREEDRIKLINTNGEEIHINGTVQAGGDFVDGLAIVTIEAVDGLDGCQICPEKSCEYLINTDGDIIIGHSLGTELYHKNILEEEPILVKDYNKGYDGLYGYMNKKGEWVIEPEYEYAKSFSNGFAGVRIDGKWGYIDEDGYIIVDPYFDSANEFNKEGFATARIGEGVYQVDVNGRITYLKNIDGGLKISK